MKTSLVTALVTMIAGISLPHAMAPTSGHAETLYVDSGGIGVHLQAAYVFPGIQAAIDAAGPGDRVVVPNGTYTENVVINKALTLESKNGPLVTTVVAADPEVSVFTINAKKVTLSGFTACGATSWSGAAGVYLSPQSGKCTITNNRFGVSPTQQNGSGIFLYESNGNTISQNDCRYNKNSGIMATGSNHNILHDNTFRFNDENGISFDTVQGNIFSGNDSRYNAENGIVLWISNNNIFIGNVSKYNSYGISFFGSIDQPSSGNILIQNDVGDNDSYGIYIKYGVGDRLIMNAIQNNGNGIVLYESSSTQCWLNNLKSNSSRQVNPGDSSNQWFSPTIVWYTYNGNVRTHLLGNYFHDHDLSDTYGDGVADTAYDLLSDGEPAYDWFPLATPSTDPTWDWDVISEFEKIISFGSDLQVLSTLTIVSGRVSISGAVLTIGMYR